MRRTRLGTLVLVLLVCWSVPALGLADDGRLVVGELETRNYTDTRLGDGRHRIDIYNFPVQMRGGDSDWVDIDPAFAPDGTLSGAPYDLSVDLENMSADIEDKLSGASGSIRLESVFDNLPEPAKAKVPFGEVTPVVRGNKITWTEIVKDMDVEFVALPEGVLFRRILKTKHAPKQGAFVVTGNLPIRYQAHDKDGKPVKVKVTHNGNSTTEEFGEDIEEDQYPVTIDPVLLQPGSKDTFLSEDAPNTNYGTAGLLRNCDEVARTARTLVEFDISMLPAGLVVDSASFEMYYSSFVGVDPVGKVAWAYKQTRTDWVEDEATWNDYKAATAWTAPGGDYVVIAPVGGNVAFPAAPGWMLWNVKPITQDAATGGSGVVELLVKFAVEGLGVGFSSLPNWRSSEYDVDTALRPKLSIEYTGLPLLSTLAATEITMGDGTHATLRGNLSYLGGSPSTVWFDWGYDTSYGGAVGTQAAAATGTYTAALSGYDPTRTVHYRFAAQNVSGTAYGSDATFAAAGGGVTAYRLMWEVVTAILAVIVLLTVIGLGRAGGWVAVLAATVIGAVALVFVRSVLLGMWQ